MILADLHKNKDGSYGLFGVFKHFWPIFKMGYSFVVKTEFRFYHYTHDLRMPRKPSEMNLQGTVVRLSLIE